VQAAACKAIGMLSGTHNCGSMLHSCTLCDLNTFNNTALYTSRIRHVFARLELPTSAVFIEFQKEASCYEATRQFFFFFKYWMY
jgi:hypothetical protein